jgi:hypothetical protein
MRPARHGAVRLAVGLDRVSTAEQGHSGLGLEAQQASVRAYVEAQGWTLVAEYSDVASGKDDCLPGFLAAFPLPAAWRGPGRRGPGDEVGRTPPGPGSGAAAGRGRHRLGGNRQPLTAQGVPTLRGSGAWTHNTTVARVLTRVRPSSSLSPVY